MKLLATFSSPWLIIILALLGQKKKLGRTLNLTHSSRKQEGQRGECVRKGRGVCAQELSIKGIVCESTVKNFKARCGGRSCSVSSFITEATYCSC